MAVLESINAVATLIWHTTHGIYLTKYRTQCERQTSNLRFKHFIVVFFFFFIKFSSDPKRIPTWVKLQELKDPSPHG